MNNRVYERLRYEWTLRGLLNEPCWSFKPPLVLGDECSAARRPRGELSAAAGEFGHLRRTSGGHYRQWTRGGRHQSGAVIGRRVDTARRPRRQTESIASVLTRMAASGGRARTFHDSLCTKLLTAEARNFRDTDARPCYWLRGHTDDVAGMVRHRRVLTSLWRRRDSVQC